MLELQFLAAAAELSARQAELVAVVADALGIPPYEYWILGRGRGDPRLDEVELSRDGRWRFKFHGLEFDAFNLADGRCVRVDFGVGGQVAFTPGGVGSFVVSSKSPWGEFPVLKDALRPAGARDYSHQLCVSLAGGLFEQGLIAHAAPSLVDLIARRTRFVPGRGHVVDIPPDERPPAEADLLTCDGASAELRAKRPGATKRALASAEKRLGRALPDDLAAVLHGCDGGPSFDGYELLSLADIIDTWSTQCALLADGKLKSRPIADPRALRKWWSPAWVPFARDSCGNIECIDLGTVRPRRIRLEVQDAQGAYALAGSFTRWLRGYLDRLKSGDLVVDAGGFVSEKTVLPDVIDKGPTRPELTGKDLASVHAALNKDAPERVLAVLDSRKLGPDVDLEYNRSLLGVAAEQRRTRVLRALLDRGADIDAADDNGRSALFWAAWGPKSDLALVKLLLDRGANPNRRTKFDGTPLHSAIMWEDAEVVAAMIRAGADPSVPDASGQTARASAAGKKSLLDALGGRASRTGEHVGIVPPNKAVQPTSTQPRSTRQRTRG